MDKAIHYIDQLLLQLVKKANLTQFEKQLNHNLQLKKNKSCSEVDFFTQLKLNIVYFQEIKRMWNDFFLEAFGQKELPKVSYIEQELLAKQMQARQHILEKSSDYTSIIQEQYLANSYSENTIQFEYAKASIEHSLRIDFITVLVMNKQSENLLRADLKELLIRIEQKINDYSNEIVEKIQLN